MEPALHILLLEDNPADSRLLDIFLREAFSVGYKLKPADTLEKALSLLQEEKFDIIIADLSLPDSSGLDTFKTIHETRPDTPVIVLTGLEDEPTGINAVKLGAQDFLIKGKIKGKTLYRSINYSIERFKLLDQLSENARKLEEKTFDLLKEKQKLSEAQKLAHIGSWELDLNSREMKYSEELWNILDLEPQAKAGNLDDFLERIHTEDRDIVRRALDSTEQSLEPFNFYHRIVRPNQSVRILHARGEVMSDKNGKPVTIIGTGQDVTERFHEEELEKLVLAATKSYNSVIICDRNGVIEWVNEGFTILSGYQAEDVKNTMGEVLKKGSEKEILIQRNYYARVLKEKGPVSFENMNYAKDGAAYWTITTLTPVLGRNNEVERIIAIDSDITMRKQMEEELLHANRIAEHSLMKGNKALNELLVAKKQLEESMKVKEQFLANMSHEIRTPMNAIVGFTDLLLKTSFSEDQKQYIEAIKTAGGNLLVIINDILDFSKIQSGKITFEAIELKLSRVCNGLTEILFHNCAEKGIKLVTEVDEHIPDTVVGDPTRLNQILLNLVGNAIKFTEKGEVRLNIRLDSEDDETVALAFEVKDTGIGIPVEKLSTIFEGFTQASNETTRKYGGTGLGLTIVKQLVEMQGGKISVESEVGKGSTFTIRMKFRKAAGPAANGSAEMAKDTQISDNVIEGLRILLVEDNYLNQVLARKVLSDWKCDVDVAENGLVALRKVEEKEFDLILMDIQLPEMDGYETTRHIRQKFQHPRSGIPIIAMTAHAIKGEIEKCFHAGMNDYVSKPFDPHVLYTKIVNVCQNWKPDTKLPPGNARELAIVPAPNTVIEKNGQSSKKPGEMITNLNYLHKLSNGNPAFVREMVNLFIQQTPPALKTMHEAMDQQDWPALRAQAHKMKASFTFVGLDRIRPKVDQMEGYAEKKEHVEEIPGLLGEIENVVNAALEELTRQLETQS